MIKPMLSLTSAQKSDERSLEEKARDVHYFKKLEKLNNEFNRHITMAQFSPVKPKSGKYRIEFPFLFIWDY